MLTLLHVLHHFLRRIPRLDHLIILGANGSDIEVQWSLNFPIGRVSDAS